MRNKKLDDKEREEVTDLKSGAIERIINAVGMQSISNAFDPHGLAFELSMALRVFRSRQTVLLAMKSKKIAAAMRALAVTSKRLRSILQDDAIHTALLATAHVTKAGDYKALGLQQPYEVPFSEDGSTTITIYPDSEFLPRAIAAVQILEERAKAHQLSSSSPHSSPIKTLIGEDLPRIFEAHFKRKFGRSRSAQQIVGGPGIRFVRTALQEMGIRKPNGRSYSSETIARYTNTKK